jgi:hypothetical protein
LAAAAEEGAVAAVEGVVVRAVAPRGWEAEGVVGREVVPQQFEEGAEEEPVAVAATVAAAVMLNRPRATTRGRGLLWMETTFAQRRALSAAVSQ